MKCGVTLLKRDGEEPNKIWQKHISKKYYMGYDLSKFKSDTRVPEKPKCSQIALKHYLNQITKIHNIMATSKAKIPTAVASTRKADPKFKVIPNLSLRGKDIMQRLKNRSITIDQNGHYSMDEKVDATRRMSKLDIYTEASKNKNQINSLTNKLNANASKSNKPGTGGGGS